MQSTLHSQAVPKKLNQTFVPSQETMKRDILSMLTAQTGMFQELNLLMTLEHLTLTQASGCNMAAFTRLLINATQSFSSVLTEWLRTGDIGAQTLHQVLMDPLLETQFFCAVVQPILSCLLQLVKMGHIHPHTLLKANTKQCLAHLLSCTPVQWLTIKQYRDCFFHIVFRMLTAEYKLVTLSNYVDLMVIEILKQAKPIKKY
jgi:hypothetical protein